MNRCLKCGNTTHNPKFCSSSCSAAYNNKGRVVSSETKKKTSNTIKSKGKAHGNVIIVCQNCGSKKEVSYTRRHQKFCSASCGSKFSWKQDKYRVTTLSRIHSAIKSDRHNINKKISKTLTGTGFGNVTIVCKNCGKEKEVPYKCREHQFCSQGCASKYLWKDPVYRHRAVKRISVRRSKNEIRFAELCVNAFGNVKCNEPMFNGWDADVILPDYKIAVLWNGIWHYQKVRKDHLLKQVQSRDIIKLREILKCGYHPYVIKDMGKYSKKFVDMQFQKFLIYARTSPDEDRLDKAA